MSAFFEDEDAPGLPGPPGATPYLIHYTDTFTGTLYDRSAGAPSGPPNDEFDSIGVHLDPG
jgi:hypothetical protein